MNNAVDLHINNFFKGFIGPNNTPGWDTYTDPTYIGFKLVFDFSPQYRAFDTGLTEDPLFADPTANSLESAQRYLTAIGYPQRAAMLAEFKSMLQFINTKTPWYFQTIDGLADIWKIGMAEEYNNYRGKDKVLTITCNESIDLRITALADLYRKATFDPKYMRQLLPENLRYFSLKVQLAEMRSFRKITQLTTQATGQNPNTNSVPTSASTLELLNGLISVLEFRFNQCEFDFNDSFLLEDAVNMGSDMVMAKQRFKIKTRIIREFNTYQLLDLAIGDGPNESQFVIPGMSKSANISTGAISGQVTPAIPADIDAAFNPRNIGNQQDSGIPGLNGKDLSNSNVFGNPPANTSGPAGGVAGQLQNLLPTAAANLTNQASSAITGAALGNVYGLQNQQIATIINGFTGQNQQIPPLGPENVYPGGTGKTPEPNVPSIGNVYDPNVVPGPPTNGSNIGGNVYK